MGKMAMLTRKGIDAVNKYFTDGDQPEDIEGVEFLVLSSIGASDPEALEKLPKNQVENAAGSLLEKGYIYVGSWYPPK
jgi:hypothetical protein